jgi:sugar transferase (PEP-CTERM system associated)
MLEKSKAAEGNYLVAHIRLFNHYIHIPYIVLGLLEAVLLGVAVYIGAWLRFGEGMYADGQTESIWLIRAIVFAVVMMACNLAMGVYDSRLREGFASMAMRSVVSYCLLGGAALTILYYIFPMLYMGRGVLFLAVMISLVLVMPARWLFFAMVGAQQLRRRILIFGAGSTAARIQSAIFADKRQFGIDIVGCVVAGEETPSVDADKVVRCLPQDLMAYAHSQKVNEIVIALDERRRGGGAVFPLAELLDCKLSGITVLDAMDFYERETGQVELSLLTPSWMLFSTGFRYSTFRDVGKRIFDIAVSLLLLAIAWPFMVLTAIAVVLESGRPIFYGQVRVGLNGKHFTVYKFRSMTKDAEKDGKAVWAQKNDSRVTRVGSFIRNTRLDELPQLYNVLKGDMSFIGPRPERPEFVVDLVEKIPFYDQRHRVKPGLMGWAQLKYPYGASVEDAVCKLRYDLYYTKNHSLLLDLLILVQTVEVILLGKGVH